MTHPTDTLTVNSHYLELFKDDAAYDYNRELMQTESNYLEQFLRWLGDLFHVNVNNVTQNENFEVFWWIGGILAILLVIWLLTRSRTWFFRRGGGDGLDYEVENDNIHEIDFETEIQEAARKKNYRSLCRLIYLQTLKRFSDTNIIDWKSYKTPSQYSREVNDEEFTTLTNHFLRIRYGNFEASAELAQLMREKQEHLLATHIPQAEEKGGDDETE